MTNGRRLLSFHHAGGGGGGTVCAQTNPHIAVFVYSLGWESQLLETGFLAIFLCPVLKLRQVPERTPTSWVVVFGYRWLIFRIMFGAVSVAIALPSRYTRKNAQVVTNLQQTSSNIVPLTTCQQDVFALLIPSLLTSYRRLVLLQGCSTQQTCYKFFQQLVIVNNKVAASLLRTL